MQSDESITPERTEFWTLTVCAAQLAERAAVADDVGGRRHRAARPGG